MQEDGLVLLEDLVVEADQTQLLDPEENEVQLCCECVDASCMHAYIHTYVDSLIHVHMSIHVQYMHVCMNEWML